MKQLVCLFVSETIAQSSQTVSPAFYPLTASSKYAGLYKLTKHSSALSLKQLVILGYNK